MLGKLEVQEVHVVKRSSHEAAQLDALLYNIERASALIDGEQRAKPGDQDYVSDCSACVPAFNGYRHHARCPRY